METQSHYRSRGRPNLVFILADQFRAMCLEPGGDPVRTPALDELAEGAAVLSNAVSNYPVCSPHRAMFMTGQYPGTNGVTHNINSETAPWGVGLKAGVPSWAGVLKEAGYQTGYIGKWHLEPPTAEDAIHGRGPLADGRVWDAYSPLERRHGFDFWYSYGCCDRHLTPHYWTGDAPREERIDVQQWSAAHETDVALDFLSRAADEIESPFALVVSYNPPHQPFDELPPGHSADYALLPPEQLLNRPNVDLASEAGREAAEIAPLYYAAVSAIDEQVKRITDCLERLDLSGDTIVVFTSDHGQQMGSHDLLYKNVPYEESMRLPCLIRWPNRIAPGVQPAVFASVDIAPTLLGLTGLADRIPTPMQGRNIAPVLLADAQEEHGAAAMYYFYPRSERDDDVRGLRSADWKIIARHKADGELQVEGFNLKADPFELAPVGDHQILARWAGRLVSELEARDDPWLGLDALKLLAPVFGPSRP